MERGEEGKPEDLQQIEIVPTASRLCTEQIELADIERGVAESAIKPGEGGDIAEEESEALETGKLQQGNQQVTINSMILSKYFCRGAMLR